MKKLLFILPALPDYEPYVFNYFRIAEENTIGYDVVCWNRKGEKVELPDNYFVYQHPTNDAYSKLKKIKEIYGFYRFVRKTIRGKDYQTIFTFTIADSVFFTSFLTHKYKGRYVFDIRDYSPMIKNRFFYMRIKRLIQNSACNVISSEGFKAWLPDQYRYIVCHNTDVEKIRQSTVLQKVETNKKELTVLTIGSLRNIATNQRVIDALSNKKDIKLRFVGDGMGAPVLKLYCEENRYNNIEFYGRYKKTEEDDFVMESDLINILLPRCANSDYVMANRFYLSALFRKPMIVNEGCFQAEQAKKYGLGLVVGDIDNLYETLVSYWENLDWNQYDANCSSFLDVVFNEMQVFKDTITRIMLREITADSFN